MSRPDVVGMIVAKRDGETLSRDAIQSLVQAYTQRDVPDYQMSAFLMATFLRGLDADETLALTDAMLHSGDVLDLSGIPELKVDKHSTGGVGDKVSLLLGPIVAACGVPVPMMSGRGLGHTGGTLDKLESIPGFSTQLDVNSIEQQLRELRLAMFGQSERVAPADRLLYALRDVTGTVESIPLIASSIMSKKLAEGIDALVFDVKVGSGAFMKEKADARRLAELLVALAERGGKRAVAWLTDMDEPLGRAVGNWPEVAETVAGLRGDGPLDLMEVTLQLAGEMIWLGGKADSPAEGIALADQAVSSGTALETLLALVDAQGGDTAAIEDPTRRTNSSEVHVVRAPDKAEGQIARIDARLIGLAAVHLGAGRAKKEDDVDPLAGIVLERVAGDEIRPGEALARLYASTPGDFSALAQKVIKAFSFSSDASDPSSRLIERLA